MQLNSFNQYTAVNFKGQEDSEGCKGRFSGQEVSEILTPPIGRFSGQKIADIAGTFDPATSQDMARKLTDAGTVGTGLDVQA